MLVAVSFAFNDWPYREHFRKTTWQMFLRHSGNVLHLVEITKCADRRSLIATALDIQLKVLQALPSLLQNYASSLTGKLLIAAFQVCFLLYSSKTTVVSNTAAAALQQLTSSTFEKAATSGRKVHHDVSKCRADSNRSAIQR